MWTAHEKPFWADSDLQPAYREEGDASGAHVTAVIIQAKDIRVAALLLH